MHGNDVIYWTESLSKLLGTELFSNVYNAYDFETNPKNQPDIEFWLDDKQYDEN
jgi:hypothetical protein